MDELADGFAAIFMDTEHGAHEHVVDASDLLDFGCGDRWRNALEALQFHGVFLVRVFRIALVRGFDEFSVGLAKGQ